MAIPLNESKVKQDILIIDDDKVILQILAKILRKGGYNVDTAETRQDAVTRLQNKQYAAAVIDVKLQDANGLDILKKIRETSPKTVGIMLTGYPSDEDRIKAQEQGAAQYLSKPVQAEKLINIIQNELSKRQTSKF